MENETTSTTVQPALQKEGKFDFVLKLPVDSQKAMYNTFADTTEAQAKTIEELKKQILIKDQMLDVAATSGFNMSGVMPQSIIGKHLGIEEADLVRKYEKAPEEYAKTTYTTYDTLMKTKFASLKAQQIDVNGNSVIVQLRNNIKFFDDRRDSTRWKPEDYGVYPAKVEGLCTAFDGLIKYKAVQAETTGIQEAFAHSMLHFGVAMFKSNAKLKQEIFELKTELAKYTKTPVAPLATNGEFAYDANIEMAQKQAINDKAVMAAVEKTPVVDEKENKVNMLEEMYKTMKEKMDKLTAKKDEEVEEEQPQSDDEEEKPAKKGGKR